MNQHKKSQHSCGRWAPTPHLSHPCCDFTCGELGNSGIIKEQGERGRANSQGGQTHILYGGMGTHTQEGGQTHTQGGGWGQT